MNKPLPPGIKPSGITTAEQAIAELRSMQAQIIHGPNVFGDIADIIETLVIDSLIEGRPKESPPITDDEARWLATGLARMPDGSLQ